MKIYAEYPDATPCTGRANLHGSSLIGIRYDNNETRISLLAKENRCVLNAGREGTVSRDLPKNVRYSRRLPGHRHLPPVFGLAHVSRRVECYDCDTGA